MHRPILSRPNDPSRDFCQWPYVQPNPSAPNALRQSTLLFEAVSRWPDGAVISDRLTRVREYFGPFNTVWGLKSAKDKNDLDLELYFYDYDRAERGHSLRAVADALPDLLPVAFQEIDQIPFFMWSVEFCADGTIPRDIDIYTDGFGGTRSGGICHTWDGFDLRLKNVYHFFDTATDIPEINAARESSARTSRLLPGPDWMTPGKWGEQIFVFAQKRASDAVYLSRLDTDATLALSKETCFPAWLSQAMEDHRDALNHHLWDVGLDYVESAGEARLVKASLYGLL